MEGGRRAADFVDQALYDDEKNESARSIKRNTLIGCLSFFISNGFHIVLQRNPSTSVFLIIAVSSG